jgi:predicted amidohydrolase
MDPSESSPAPTRYLALALQIRTASVGHLANRDAARELMRANIRRVAGAIRSSIAFIRQYDGADVRLVMLPEYFMTGSPPAGSGIASWRDKVGLEPGGAEYAELSEIASANQIYLAGNAYEADRHFPQLYFQTSFILGPAGDCVLRYRRLISLYSPSPYDVWDRYLEIYGESAIFPVADTEIGRLAAIASEEILYPEIARCHAMRGAEIFVHSTSEMGSPIATAKDIGKRARAAENLAYVVSANASGVDNTALPVRSTTGMAKIIDYDGRILAVAMPGGDSMVANAAIDVGALRATPPGWSQQHAGPPAFPGLCRQLSSRRLPRAKPAAHRRRWRPAHGGHAARDAAPRHRAAGSRRIYLTVGHCCNQRPLAALRPRPAFFPSLCPSASWSGS